MPCHICKKNQATVHLTEIVNHTIREMHICEACAQEHQLKISASPLEPIAQGLVPSPLPDVPEAWANRKCPACGMTLQQFRSKIRFGCPNDYEFFQEVVLPVLAKIQGATQYRGKVPKGKGSPEVEAAHQLYRLEQELKKLIQAEKYEAAAQVRDQIQTLRGKSSDAASSSEKPSSVETKKEEKKTKRKNKV